MSEPTISIAEYRALVRETILHVARCVPPARRAEFLEGLEAELENAFTEIADTRRSPLHPVDGSPDAES